MKRKILITGGAGFIGSALVRYLLAQGAQVINVDKLTYAANLRSLQTAVQNPDYFFERADICDGARLQQIFQHYQPDAVIHLAAESHVDRSIQRAADFIQSNIVGSYQLLEVALQYWRQLTHEKQAQFRFLHVSTDEVYGDLTPQQPPFNEQNAYVPSSPYSASKAASDHLVRAWYRTYGFPAIISHCSNNYGPYQHPEKLIPLMIAKALAGEPLPIYGHGLQIRDWLFVEDHVRALALILQRGKVGESYNIGGNNPQRNIDVVRQICALLEQFAPNKPQGVAHYADLISHVADRLGHDQRYAIDASKIREQLAWQPQQDFASGLAQTVQWYVANQDWCCASSVS